MRYGQDERANVLIDVNSIVESLSTLEVLLAASIVLSHSQSHAQPLEYTWMGS